jgi:tetratricopeptide (TPR) repeat protein
MRRFPLLCGLLLWVLLSSRTLVLAQTMTAEQRSQFLELLPPPSVSFQFGFSFNRSGFSVNSEDMDKQLRLAQLLLKKTPEAPRARAKHLSELASAYRDNGDNTKAIASAAEAARLLQPLTEKPSPIRETLLHEFGDALFAAEKRIEAEKIYRQAAKEYPKSWKALLDVASYLESDAMSQVFLAMEVTLGDMNALAAKLTERKIPPTLLAKINKNLEEATVIRQRARKLAPQEPELVREQMASNFTRRLVKAFLESSATGKPLDANLLTLQILTNDEQLKELDDLAVLQPKDPLPLMTAITFRLLRTLMENQNAATGPAEMTDAEEARIKKVIKRLQEIGEETKHDKETRGRAWEGAAVLYLVLKEYEDVFRCFEASRKAAPERSGAWLGSIFGLIELKRNEEAYRLAEEFFVKRKTPFNRLILANTALKANRLREAEAEYRLLKDDKSMSVKATLGLITTLMRRSEKEPNLLDEAANEYRTLFDRLEKNFGEDFGSSLFVVAGLQALSGDVKSAISTLELARKEDSDNEEKADALIKILNDVR